MTLLQQNGVDRTEIIILTSQMSKQEGPAMTNYVALLDSLVLSACTEGVR